VEAGTFGGNASFSGQLVATGGNVAPGIGAGRLTVGGFDLQSPATLKIELNGAAAGTGYDQILLPASVMNGVTLAGNLEGTLGFIPTVGDVFLIILNGGTTALEGTFANAPTDLQTVLVSGVPFTIDYGFNGDGDGVLNDVALIAQVPEPSSLLALVGGCGMLAGLAPPCP
jgi:fibronectin-binding autotransporter adhesin